MSAEKQQVKAEKQKEANRRDVHIHLSARQIKSLGPQTHVQLHLQYLADALIQRDLEMQFVVTTKIHILVQTLRVP